MILEDALEFTAVDNHAFQLVNQTSHGQVLWRFTVRNAMTFTILDLNTKAVSLLCTVFFYFLILWSICM